MSGPKRFRNIIMGFTILWLSPALGYNAAKGFFFPLGNGSADVAQFNIMFILFSVSFILTGLILCIIGIINYSRK